MDKEKYFENIKSLKLLAKHEVGQNFLINPTVCENIVNSLEINENDAILEIGCGAGSLSYFLSLGPAKSTLIDIDEGLLTKLAQDFQNNEFVKPIMGNAMKFDYSPYDKIIGNLPYYITSGIIEKALLGATSCKRMVFMVQKEAADRILAKKDCGEYSPLNILLYLSSEPKKLFNVDRASFTPAPHVDSTVMAFQMKTDRDVKHIAETYKLATRLFQQRRKTIYNNLKGYLGDKDRASSILASLCIDLNLRPENLSPEQYSSITKLIKK